MAHMAMGEEWEAVEVKDGEVVAIHRVKAGEALRDLLLRTPKYMRSAGLATSVAGVRGFSPLSVPVVDWELRMCLTDKVVVGAVVIRSTTRSNGWNLPRDPRTNRVLQIRRDMTTRVYHLVDGKRVVDLPTAAEVEHGWVRTTEGVGWGTPARAGDEVSVTSDLDVMTNVDASDPRRQSLLRVCGRREEGDRIVRFGHHVRVEWVAPR